MFSTSDTIVAIATPPGRGGLGVIRISGPGAARIAGSLTHRQKPLSPRVATFATVKVGAGSGSNQDHVVLTYFAAPASYTGEDVVEISAHGSPVVLQAIVRAAVDAGARLAEPGEFTLRAFLHQKLDLVQAEAVGDLIEAVTPLQARAAFDQLEGTLTERIRSIDAQLFDVIAKLEASLDFPDEGYHFVGADEAASSINALVERIDHLLRDAARGRLIREGAQVAIVGAPNVGKSSLFNALLNTDRAIVTPIAGTTRDVLTERADLGGLVLSLVDTAGVRDTTDMVEREGVARSRAALAVADVVIVLLDRSRPVDDADRALLAETARFRRIVVLNKSDLSSPSSVGDQSELGLRTLEVSAKTGDGLDALIEAIGRVLGDDRVDRDQPAITNVRHIALLERARDALNRARTSLAARVSEEFPLLDLQEASASFQEVTGQRASDDLLHHIFARFCIGK